MISHKLAGITLLAILKLVFTSVQCKSKNISILSLLPYPDPLFNPLWREGPSISLALDMARDQINNQTELLPDYHIELLHDDSGCEFETKAYVAFLKNVYYSGYNITGIIGPGCSSSILSLARLTSYDQIGIVTLHGGGNTLLSDRSTYHYALSSIGSSDLYFIAGLGIIRKSNWTQVGVLIGNSQQFHASNVAKVLEYLRSTHLVNIGLNVNILPTVFNTFFPLDDIIRKGLRINFLFTPTEITQRILCVAMYRGMVYNAYQWIVTSNFFEEVAKDVTFMYNKQLYSCSEEEMKMVALNQVLFFNLQLSALNETASSTYSKYSFREYDQLFREKIDKYNSQSELLNRSNISYSIWSTYFYDSLWAWSVALDRLSRNNPSLDLTKYKYGDTTISDMLLKQFYSLDFEGVSGRIKFQNETGFVIRAMSVFRVVSGKPSRVAYYNTEEGFVLTTERFEPISDNFENRTQLVGKEVVAVFISITLLQLVTLVSLHILSIKYRQYPSVRASSLRLQQVLYTGCYIFILTLLVLTINGLGQFNDFTLAVMCNLTWAWLLPISFSLTFGTVAARTWRLYRIFTHYLNPGHFIGDYYLMVFVLFFLLVDIVLGTVWVSVDPQQVKYLSYRTLKGAAMFQVRVRQCINSNYEIFYATVLGLRAVLVVIVFVLVVLTRSIKNQSFTTKTLRILVYLFSIVMLVGFVTYYVSLFFDPLSSLSFISIITTLNIMLFLFICFIFLPPLVPLLQTKILAERLFSELKTCDRPK